MVIVSSVQRMTPRSSELAAAEQERQRQLALAQNQLQGIPQMSASTKEAMEAGYLTPAEARSAYAAQSAMRDRELARAAGNQEQVADLSGLKTLAEMRTPGGQEQLQFGQDLASAMKKRNAAGGMTFDQRRTAITNRGDITVDERERALAAISQNEAAAEALITEEQKRKMAARSSLPGVSSAMGALTPRASTRPGSPTSVSRTTTVAGQVPIGESPARGESAGFSGLDPGQFPEEGLFARREDRAYAEAIGAVDEFKGSEIDVREAKERSEQSAYDAYSERLAFESKIDDLSRDRQDEKQRARIAENERALSLARIEQTRAEQVVRQQNIDQELQNRRLSAKLGINFDTSGLQWMQEESRRGAETLSYLIARNAVTEKQFSDQYISIIENYDQNMRSIDLQSLASANNAYADLQTSLSAVETSYIADRKERKKLRDDAIANYSKILNENDLERAKLYAESRKSAQEYTWKVEDREFEAWKIGQQEAGKSMISVKDSLEWARTIENDIQNLPSYKTFSEVSRNLSNINDALSLMQQGKISAQVFDETVITAFGNIKNPEATLRQAQVSISQELQPWYQKWARDGIAAAFRDTLPNDQVRQEIVDLSSKIYESQRQQLITDIMPKLQRLESFNYQPGMQVLRPLVYSDVVSPDIISALGIPEQEFEQGALYVQGGRTPPGMLDLQDGLQSMGARVTQGFDQFVDYIKGRTYHGGYDIAPVNQSDSVVPVVAFSGGTVVDVMKDPNPGKKQGWGNEVWVESNGVYHRYAHFDSTSVKVGDKIAAGQPLGVMGNTGYSTARHVHYEAHRWGKDGPLVDVFANGRQPTTIARTTTVANASPAPLAIGGGVIPRQEQKRFLDLVPDMQGAFTKGYDFSSVDPEKFAERVSSLPQRDQRFVDRIMRTMAKSVAQKTVGMGANTRSFLQWYGRYSRTALSGAASLAKGVGQFFITNVTKPFIEGLTEDPSGGFSSAY